MSIRFNIAVVQSTPPNGPQVPDQMPAEGLVHLPDVDKNVDAARLSVRHKRAGGFVPAASKLKGA